MFIGQHAWTLCWHPVALSLNQPHVFRLSAGPGGILIFVHASRSIPSPPTCSNRLQPGNMTFASSCCRCCPKASHGSHSSSLTTYYLGSCGLLWTLFCALGQSWTYLSSTLMGISFRYRDLSLVGMVPENHVFRTKKQQNQFDCF